MGVLDEIRNQAKNSISIEKTSSIIENLVKKALTYEAEEAYKKFIEKAKKKSSQSEVLIENGKKTINGTIDFDTQIHYTRIEPVMQEEIKACNLFEQNKSLFKDKKILNDIREIHFHKGNIYNHDYFDIKLILISHIEKNTWFSGKRHSYLFTESGKFLYDKFLELIGSEKESFEPCVSKESFNEINRTGKKISSKESKKRYWYSYDGYGADKLYIQYKIICE